MVEVQLSILSINATFCEESLCFMCKSKMFLLSFFIPVASSFLVFRSLT